MEFRLHLHHWERREPDWSAAAVSGFAAGAVLMVLELIWVSFGDSGGPWRISQMVAALTLGQQEVLHAPAHVFQADIVAAALLTHYGLGVAFGLALGVVVAGFRIERQPGAMALAGVLFGLALYVINFYGVTTAFPWFAELRGWVTLAAHVAFGLTTSLLYWRLARRGSTDPPSSAPSTPRR
ncbi:MAG TPA: hypothetical protein VLA16_16340 [Ideonella sp.]|nr:hypothetical protein [Ideonella sp.]